MTLYLVPQVTGGGQKTHHRTIAVPVPQCMHGSMIINRSDLVTYTFVVFCSHFTNKIIFMSVWLVKKTRFFYPTVSTVYSIPNGQIHLAENDTIQLPTPTTYSKSASYRQYIRSSKIYVVSLFFSRRPVYACTLYGSMQSRTHSVVLQSLNRIM